MHERSFCVEADFDPDVLILDVDAMGKACAQSERSSPAAPPAIQKTLGEVSLPAIGAITLAGWPETRRGNRRLYRDLLGQFARRNNGDRRSADFSRARKWRFKAGWNASAHTVEGTSVATSESRRCSQRHRSWRKQFVKDRISEALLA